MIGIIERPYGRVKFWIDDMPDVQAEPISIDTEVHEVSGRFSAAARRCVVEIVWFPGGRILTGLLGAEFQPLPGRRLEAQTMYHRDDGEYYVDTITNFSDDVRKGLPEEFRRGVRDVLFGHSSRLDSLGGGTLIFEWAAHGRVGSSIAVFRALTCAVLDLMVMTVPVDENALLGTIRHEFACSPRGE